MGDVLGFVAGEILQHLGSPSDDVLKPDDAMAAALRGLRYYKHQLGAVGRLITGQYFLIDPPSQQFPISEAGFTKAVYVQRQVDAVNNIWDQVDIIEVQALDDEDQSGAYAIAFFGEPDWQAMISWDPRLEQFNRLRIWHDPEALEPGTVTDDIGIPLKIASSMIAERGALECVLKCRLRDKQTWDAETVKLFIDVHSRELSRLESEFDMWRFHSGDTGLSQMERFDRTRRAVGGRRFGLG